MSVKKQLVILTIMIGWGALVYLPAQGGFNIVYENPVFVDNGMRFDHIYMSNDTITVAGTYADDSVQASGVIVVQFDTIGNMINISTVLDTSRVTSLITNPGKSLLRCSDNGYAIPVVKSHHATLIKMSSSLEVEFVSEFHLNDRIMVPNQVIETENGYLLFGWIQRMNYNVMTFVIMMNIEGKEIWRKYYGNSSFNQWFGSAIKISENEIVIGSGIAPPFDMIIPEEDKVSKPWIYTIDSTGNMTWQWTGAEYDGAGRGVWNLKKTSDGGYVYNTGLRHVIDDNTSAYTPILVKRDSLMNLEWERDYDEGPLFTWSYFAELQVLDSDEIVMAGVRGKRYDGIGAHVGRVVKTSNIGEQTWEVTDTGLWSSIGSENFIAGMAISQTGSIYACGRTRARGPKTLGWLIKITADGCIDTLCSTTSIFDLMPVGQPKFLLYPNPTHGDFTVKVIGNTIEDFELVLMDLYGHVLYNQTFHGTSTFSLSHQYPPGMYVYSIRDTNSGKIVGSGKLMIE